MFATTPKKYSPSDSRLVQRYCEIFEIEDWRSLPKEKLGAMVFVEMPQFWVARAEWLRTDDVDELLKDTPLAGSHSLPGTPAHKRLNGV
jgi:hypothetical protein